MGDIKGSYEGNICASLLWKVDVQKFTKTYTKKYECWSVCLKDGGHLDEVEVEETTMLTMVRFLNGLNREI